MTTLTPWTPLAARMTLARRGPVTAAHAHAAQYYLDRHSDDPRWAWWAVLEVATAVAVVVAPDAWARVVAAGFATVFAWSAWRGSRRPEVTYATVFAQAGASRRELTSRYATLAVAVAVGALVVAGTALWVPLTTLRLAAVCLGVLAVRNAAESVLAHVRAARVMAAAPSQPWFAEYVADRELRRAAATVALDPEE